MVIGLIDKNRVEILEEIISECNSNSLKHEIQETSLLKSLKNYKNYFPSDMKIEGGLSFPSAKVNSNYMKLWLLSWFTIHKNILLGRVIGSKLSKDDIPEIYKNVINKAIELQQNE